MAYKNCQRSIRDDRWKLIRYPLIDKTQLFDLQADLSETNNVAGANPDVVERLTALMHRYIAEGRSTVGTPQKNEAEMSVDNAGPGKMKRGGHRKNGKNGKKNSEEEALADDPKFD